MNYQNYPGEVIDAEYTEVISTPRGGGTGLLNRRTSAMMGRVVEEAMVLGAHDQCLAMLAKAGMEHTAALAMMEQQLSRMTPQAAERYREIVDAYAQKAADKVMRW